MSSWFARTYDAGKPRPAPEQTESEPTPAEVVVASSPVESERTGALLVGTETRPSVTGVALSPRRGTQPSAPFSTLNGMSEGLDRVKRAAANRQAAERELRQAIIEAVKHHSIRQVAAAAGLGPTRIHQIKEEG